MKLPQSPLLRKPLSPVMEWSTLQIEFLLQIPQFHEIPRDKQRHKETVPLHLSAVVQAHPRCAQRVLIHHQALQGKQGYPCSLQCILPGELLAAVYYILYFKRRSPFLQVV